MSHLLFKLQFRIDMRNIKNLLISIAYFSTTIVQASLIANPGGTVTDSETGLVWDRCVLGLSGSSCSTGSAKHLSWSDALREVDEKNSTNHLGFSDWRLPDVKELESIVKSDVMSPAIDAAFFPNTPTDWNWTSTILAADPAKVFNLSFDHGTTAAQSKTHVIFVARLVRGGSQSYSDFDLLNPTDLPIVFSSSLAILQRAGGLHLSWVRASGDIVRYELYRSDQAGVAGAKIYSGNDNQFIDSEGQIDGHTYYYSIKACSNTVCVFPNNSSIAQKSYEYRDIASPVLSVESSRFFAWVEKSFMEAFPPGPENQKLDGYIYRRYNTGNILAIYNGNVFAIGPITDGNLLGLGTLTQYECFYDPRVVGCGSQKIDLLYRADSNVAKALLGKKYFDLNDIQLNIEKLDSSNHHRMALQIYYENRSILDESFALLKAKSDGIDRTRETINSAIDVGKGLVDIGLLSASNPSNNLQTAQHMSDLVKTLINSVNSSAKTVGLITDFDEQALSGVTLDESTLNAINVLASGFSVLAGSPDWDKLAKISDFYAATGQFSFASTETQGKFINVFGSGIKCIIAMQAADPVMAKSCMADQAELAFKALNDVGSAANLIINQRYINAHLAAQVYLEAWYKSGMDSEFMLAQSSIPVGIDAAVEYFDKIGFIGIDNSYFKNTVNNVIEKVNRQIQFYSGKISSGIKPLDISISSVDSLFGRHSVVQDDTVTIHAEVVIPDGFSHSSLVWKVESQDKSHTTLSESPFSSGSSVTQIKFHDPGRYNVTAYVELQDAAGRKSFAVGSHSLNVIPRP